MSPDAGADAVVQQAELAKEQQAKAAALKVQVRARGQEWKLLTGGQKSESSHMGDYAPDV